MIEVVEGLLTFTSIVVFVTAPRESITSTNINTFWRGFRFLGRIVLISESSRKSESLSCLLESEAEPSDKSERKSSSLGKKLKEYVSGLSRSSHPSAFI